MDGAEAERLLRYWGSRRAQGLRVSVSVRRALDSLTNRERAAIAAVYGLGSRDDPKPFQDTRGRVASVVQRALLKLSQPVRLAALREVSARSDDESVGRR